MGYDLHITRKRGWADATGPEITLEEWLAFVEQDPEMTHAADLGEHFAVWSGPSVHESPWLAWDDGNIYSKNPDRPLIAKMYQVATALGAEVQGDDGETYGSEGAPIPEKRPSFLSRLRRWWAMRGPQTGEPLLTEPLPFKVGDRVQDVFGSRNKATVVSIELRAHHGLGLITVRYDDGRVLHSSAVAHGLERVRESDRDADA